MKLIVGLGNPGNSYQQTRHNIGFMVVDMLAQEEQVHLRRHTLQTYQSGTLIQGQTKALLVKPLAYMNNSGKIIRSVIQKNGITAEQILIVCDDMDLPVGKVRFRCKGTDGGHLGLRSIVEFLGTEDFCRIRVGVGKPEHKNAVKEYVLSRFTDLEKETIEKSIKISVFTCKEWLFYGISKSITYNLN